MSLANPGLVIDEMLSLLGGNTRRRIEAESDWDNVLDAAKYVPVQYMNSILDYQLEYHQAVWSTFSDFSCVIYSSGRAAAIWPLTLSWTNGVASLNSYGLPICPPLFSSSATPREIAAITRNCQDLLHSLGQEHHVASWTSEETSVGAEGASDWIIAARLKSAQYSLTFDLFINLTLQDEVIRSYMRKSYRSLINNGLKKWPVTVIGQECTLSSWQEVQELHRAVSGCVTRSQATWDLQFGQIKKGEAILIIVRADAGVLVAAAFFTFSRTEANYSMGIYDRSFSSEPLGHVVQHHAIAALKSRGCKWYRLGIDSEEEATKQASISHFKRGFATDRAFVFRTTVPIVSKPEKD